MDLFMSTMTEKEQLTSVGNDYKSLLEVEQNGKGKFKLLKGNKKHFGNCILLILPFISMSGFMNADYEKTNLIQTLEHYNITNYIIVYAQPSKSNGASRTLIKQSRPLMNKLVEIINPKLIVTFDDSSAELFLTMKPNIVEQHGTIIHHHYNIPVILTYNLDYYDKRTGYEDKKYKNTIFFEDWELISNKYNTLIT